MYESSGELAHFLMMTPVTSLGVLVQFFTSVKVQVILNKEKLQHITDFPPFLLLGFQLVGLSLHLGLEPCGS